MILFIQGQIIPLTVEQVIDLYYQAYVNEFGEISRSRWEGSKEYEIAYANAQRDVANGVIVQQALQGVFDEITEINEEIKRPAVLHSRVAERFLEVSETFAPEGYIATARVADINTKGIVAICVDYTPDETQNAFIAQLIVNEMLPAGQHMEGDISVPVVISNGQTVTATWKAPVQNDVDFKIELTIDRNSPYPQDPVDVIVERFLANFASQNALGQDIVPDSYYQIERDAPWASKIVTTYDLNSSSTYTGDIYQANYDDKFNATLDPVNVTIVDPAVP